MLPVCRIPCFGWSVRGFAPFGKVAVTSINAYVLMDKQPTCGLETENAKRNLFAKKLEQKDRKSWQMLGYFCNLLSISVCQKTMWASKNAWKREKILQGIKN